MDLRELYLEQLQDIYSAETQLVEFLPRLAWTAREDELKKAFGEHHDETKAQVECLDDVFSRHPSVKAGGHTCQAMKGLLKEATEALDTHGDSEIIDAHLIASAYRVEHYEIAAYSSAIEMAKALNEQEDLKILQANLAQEEGASKNLSKMAKGSLLSKGVYASAAS